MVHVCYHTYKAFAVYVRDFFAGYKEKDEIDQLERRFLSAIVSGVHAHVCTVCVGVSVSVCVCLNVYLIKKEIIIKGIPLVMLTPWFKYMTGSAYSSPYVLLPSPFVNDTQTVLSEWKPTSAATSLLLSLLPQYLAFSVGVSEIVCCKRPPPPSAQTILWVKHAV